MHKTTFQHIENTLGSLLFNPTPSSFMADKTRFERENFDHAMHLLLNRQPEQIDQALAAIENPAWRATMEENLLAATAWLWLTHFSGAFIRAQLASLPAEHADRLRSKIQQLRSDWQHWKQQQNHPKA